MDMLKKVEFYFEQLKNIPEVYLYLIFIVVGGNYGISVTNLLSNKVSENQTAVSMPIKNMIGIVVAVLWVCLHTQK